MLFKESGDKGSRITFLFFNGFGSDYSYWDKLIPYFQNYHCVMLSENYFNQGNDVSVDELRNALQKRYIVGVGHSLGYEKLCLLQERYDFIKLKKIVAVEGFSRYLGNNLLLRPHRKLPLDMMKVSYATNTIGTLVQFMMFCGQLAPTIPTSVNEKIFFGDLNLLDDGIVPPNIPHLVLSSLDDYIIPFYIIEDNFGKLPDVKILYTEGVGHLLGFKQLEFVYFKIMDFIQKN